MMHSAIPGDVADRSMLRSALRALPGMLRRMLPMLLLDGICPLALYFAVRPHFVSTSAIPLAIAVIFPLLGNILNLVRHRRLDTAGVFVIVSLLASLTILFLGGNARLLLLTRSLMMPVIGLSCLVSLLLPKPLAFYMVRQLVTGDEAQPGAAFDTYWRYPEVRVASRRVTMVWGIAMIGEFVARFFLAFTAPVAIALAVSSAVMMGVGIGLGVWNVVYGLRVLRRIRRLPQEKNLPQTSVQASLE